MVDVFGNEIIKAYTGGTPVKEIYAYGVLVWPTGYYIFWTPMSMSGTFTMEGETYNFEDYSGSFRFSGGVITSSAFQSTSMEWMKTDARSVYNNAFAFCSSMSQAYIESCSVIGANAFTNCTSLEYISAPSCVWVGGNAFESCKFSELYFPLCEDIEGNGFRHCKSLISIDFPVCSVVKQYAFQDCTSLTTISLPVCKTIEQGAFGGDRNIQSVSLPECSVIGSSAFTYCTSFSYLELMGSSMCKLSGNDQFLNTPFASCQGSIVVPTSLYSTYIANSKWASLSCNIFMDTYNDFYVDWNGPSNLSVYFTIGGKTYNTSDYMSGNKGHFTGFNAVITSNAFSSNYFSTVNTNALEIQTNGFRFNYDMSVLSISQCSSIGQSAFGGCTLLKKVSAPVLEYVGSAAFGVCYNLTSISLPKCTYIGSDAFYRCSSLSTVSLPKCSYIGDQGFWYCSKLGTISLPSCKTIGGGAFANCFVLNSVSLPACTYVGTQAFSSCYTLASISLPKCSYIGIQAFIGCGNLSRITLKYSSVVKLASTNLNPGSYAFSGTKITYSTGNIYVPQSLLSSYKWDDNWRYFSNRIFGI